MLCCLAQVIHACSPGMMDLYVNSACQHRCFASSVVYVHVCSVVGRVLVTHDHNICSRTQVLVTIPVM